MIATNWKRAKVKLWRSVDSFGKKEARKKREESKKGFFQLHKENGLIFFRSSSLIHHPYSFRIVHSKTFRVRFSPPQRLKIKDRRNETSVISSSQGEFVRGEERREVIMNTRKNLTLGFVLGFALLIFTALAWAGGVQLTCKADKSHKGASGTV